MSATTPPEPRPDRLLVGVLASQGDFAAHVRMLRELGAEAVRGANRRRSSPTSTRW